MQPIKIILKGDYFDCQIYRGRLYLWTLDGTLKVYNWNELINSLIVNENDKIAMKFCFMDGNYLYKSSLMEFFNDSDFKNLLISKFEHISNRNLIVTEIELNKFLFGEQQVPTGIIPTDTEIYSNRLFFINEQGFFSCLAHRDKSDKYPVGTKPLKLWDCNLLSIKANKWPQIALSGGTEGLFELNFAKSTPSNLKQVEQNAPIYQISNDHSSFSNYSFLNIYNSSTINNSFLATFKWNVTKDMDDNDIFQRDFDKSIDDKTLFKNRNKKHFISWGIDDKIYKVTSKGFEIIKYNHYAKTEKGEEKFLKLKNINFESWKGKVINGGTTYFGNIVELEDKIFIIQSDGKTITIPGPITRWRVYPRSLNYENHLHVILDDRIEIYSFNHDYFLNQKDKEIGIEFIQKKETWRQNAIRKSI